MSDSQIRVQVHGIFVQVLERESGRSPGHVDDDLGIFRVLLLLLLHSASFRVRALQAWITRIDGKAGQSLRQLGAEIVRLLDLVRCRVVDVSSTNEVSAVELVPHEAVLVRRVPHGMIAPLTVLLTEMRKRE